MSLAPGGSRVRQALRYLALAAGSLDPRRRGSPHRTPEGTYSEGELLARNAEFIEAAEQQWRTIAAEPSAREHVLNKPFSTVRDTAAILYRLGLVLDLLDLGVGHTVLDFGAGSCWLTAFLNRLRCRTVSVDVSATAVALGQQACTQGPHWNGELEARFVSYDGTRLPLEPESVDRAVCFDSFHHVPNQDAALSELHRVLRPGGRVVLAEPGEGHARSEHSQFECSHFGVLENDLELGDLFTRARRAGFDRFLSKPYADAPAITLAGEDVLRLMAGDHSVFPMHQLETSLRSVYLVALLKGEPRIDSRNPRELRGRIELPREQGLRGRAGDALSLPLRITNLGDTLWLSRLDRAGGYVSVRGHLFDETGALVARSFFSDALPRDVAPRDTLEFDTLVHLPERVGRHLLRLDLVDEKVAWFEQCGSKTVDVPLEVVDWPDSRAPHRLGARLEIVQPVPPPQAPPAAALTVRIRATNTGDTRWLRGSPDERGVVCLGVQLRDATGALIERDYWRTPLPREVDPGHAVEIDTAFPAPKALGRCQLVFDLVAEQVCWFEHHGSKPLACEIVIAT